MRWAVFLGLLFWGGVVGRMDFRQQRVDVVSFSNRDPPPFPVSAGKGVATPFSVDDNLGLGRVFDGIGAISGGGVGCFYLVLLILIMNAKLIERHKNRAPAYSRASVLSRRVCKGWLKGGPNPGSRGFSKLLQ